MTRRMNLAASISLGALLLTGIIAAQTDQTPPLPPINTLVPEGTLAVIDPEATAFILPEATAVLDSSNATSISAGAITFKLPKSVASSAEVTEEEAVPVDTTELPHDQLPAHTHVTFNGDEAYSFLDVFDTADFDEYTYPEAQLSYTAEADALEALLDERPELALEDTLPRLPLMAPPLAFHARERYINFDGGSGIFYLAYYTFDVDILLEGSIVAVFQGLSDDGSTYISAVLPINTNYLPAERPESFDYEAFSAGYGDYITSIKIAMNGQPSVTFEPTLDDLYAMFASISVVR